MREPSPSAIANAVAREQGQLGAATQAQLGQYGVDTLNMLGQGLSGVTQAQNSLQTDALQRQFSLGDFQKQLDLARQIGGSVPQAPGQSLLSGALGGGVAGAGALSALGPWGAVAGGLLGASAGASKSGGSFFCTHLKNMGLMTEDEVKAVHQKIFTKGFRHFYSLGAYWLLAPIFIVRTCLIDYPWEDLKKKLCDEVLACETSEEAFQKYKSVCISTMRPVFPRLIRFFFGKEVSYARSN